MFNNAMLRSTKELLEAEEELIREQMEKKNWQSKRSLLIQRDTAINTDDSARPENSEIVHTVFDLLVGLSFWLG